MGYEKRLSLFQDWLIFFVNIAKPFVGNGPKVKTCIPADAKPDTKAGSRVYPDNLVSFAIIATCFFL